MDEMEKIRKMRCFVFRMLKYKEIILGNFMQNEVRYKMIFSFICALNEFSK